MEFCNLITIAPFCRPMRNAELPETGLDFSLPFVKDRFAVTKLWPGSGLSKSQGDDGIRNFTMVHLPAVDVVPPPPAYT